MGRRGAPGRPSLSSAPNPAPSVPLPGPQGAAPHRENRRLRAGLGPPQQHATRRGGARPSRSPQQSQGCGGWPDRREDEDAAASSEVKGQAPRRSRVHAPSVTGLDAVGEETPGLAFRHRQALRPQCRRRRSVHGAGDVPVPRNGRCPRKDTRDDTETNKRGGARPTATTLRPGLPAGSLRSSGAWAVSLSLPSNARCM